MSRQGARRAGKELGKILGHHSRETAGRIQQREANDIGEVILAEGGHVEIYVPGERITMNEDDLSFVGSKPSELEKDDRVLMIAVGDEYVVVGVLDGA